VSGYTYIGKLKNSFICDARLSAYDVRVYLSLKKWETWEKEVKIETMAKEINMNRKSFSKSLKTLEALGYIGIKRNTNWNCNKYQIHKKAHGTESNIEGNHLPIEGNEIPLIEGNEIPLLIIPSNIPKKKKDKKEKTARVKTLASAFIGIFNNVNGSKHNINGVGFIEHISKLVKELIKMKLSDEEMMQTARRVCENKKRFAEQNDYWSTNNKIDTIYRKSKFLVYMLEEPHQEQLHPQQHPEPARKLHAGNVKGFAETIKAGT
jgi:DNA-binding transcriptional regulator YhcF (GntR family)